MKDVAKARLHLSNPTHLLATGFGSGLSPIMPGTAGSIAALPVWWLLIQFPWPYYLLLLLLSCIIGIYLCQKTADDMQVHDHGSIVWDEFVGMWITLLALPLYNWQWIAAGFLLFRLLDIYKPWPIRWFDRKLHNGLGIMIDDVLAGMLAAAILYGVAYWLGHPVPMLFAGSLG
ncbi:phosphatidylglycerophosphatase A [Serratia microhaemolytica]|uniref:phosphatidylglycerophosphatase A n=1 Tax=Serratia microhaemolytica TaxID=2675110 RepID=UPI000FDE5ADE|nr:phosphatidylglycerophosphatase A [Serratia microhaemolytica]